MKIAPATLANDIRERVKASGSSLRQGSVVSLGAYNRAWTLSRRFVKLNWRLAEMLLSTLVEHHAGGDRDGFDRALVDTLRYVAIAMLLPAAAAGGSRSS